MAVASYTDVGVALRRTISDPAEQAQLEWWLTGAELAIKSRLGEVGLLDQDVLKYVEVEAVAEKARRVGREESSVTVSVDDSTVTRRYENRMTADDITGDLWSMLSPAQAATAFSVPVGSPLDRLP